MPRVCTICTSPDRAAIEAAIASGTSFRVIARQFSASRDTQVSHDSIQRHAASHLIQAIKEAKQEQAVQSGSIALERMARGESIVDAILTFAWSEEKDGIKEPELALKALAELRRQVELRAKLEGELDERSITITAVPEWRELRALLLDALALHPQAKLAVIRALEAYDHAA